MSNELKVAILGGGRMAQKHATAIRLRAGAKLVAVGDPYISAEQIRERFGADVAAFADPHELLREVKPDIVHVVTPPHTHFELARACLLNGANVYVEKPFALNSAEAREILDLAEERGLRACAAHQVLFQRAGQQYQTYLPMIGELIHVESYFSFKPVRRRPGAETTVRWPQGTERDHQALRTNRRDATSGITNRAGWGGQGGRGHGTMSRDGRSHAWLPKPKGEPGEPSCRRSVSSTWSTPSCSPSVRTRPLLGRRSS